MIRERGITLEVCPTSNINSRVVSGWDELRWILDTFRHNGVRYTINTDGPEMLKTYIRDELAALGRLGILSVEEQLQTVEWAREASFVAAANDLPLPRRTPRAPSRGRARRSLNRRSRRRSRSRVVRSGRTKSGRIATHGAATAPSVRWQRTFSGDPASRRGSRRHSSRIRSSMANGRPSAPTYSSASASSRVAWPSTPPSARVESEPHATASARHSASVRSSSRL